MVRRDSRQRPGKQRGGLGRVHGHRVAEALLGVAQQLAAVCVDHDVGASADIVIDAYRRELLRDPEQGLGNPVPVNAAKAAALLPRSLSRIPSDHHAWAPGFRLTPAVPLPGHRVRRSLPSADRHGYV
ncbi:AmpG family muropeptide MFS transporter, partial [Burkholderia pseudomallei]